MTILEHTKQKQARQLLELCKISRQRYLDAGGNPRLSVGSLNDNDNFTNKEKQEFLELARQVFDSDYINNYLQQRHKRQTANPTAINKYLYLRSRESLDGENDLDYENC